MAHHIATLCLSTKKGETQTIRFLIKQNTPYPDTEGFSGNLRWRNAEGIIASHNNSTPKLPASYQCYLLPTPTNPIPENFNRTHLAGYENNESPLSLRGRSLGEVTITLTETYEKPNVRGFQTPTPGERKLLEEWIYPQLREFIAENRKELRHEALQTLSDTFDRQIARLEDSIETLKLQSQKALETLQKQTL
jgi:hypothetical protein